MGMSNGPFTNKIASTPAVIKTNAPIMKAIPSPMFLGFGSPIFIGFDFVVDAIVFFYLGNTLFGGGGSEFYTKLFHGTAHQSGINPWKPFEPLMFTILTIP